MVTKHEVEANRKVEDATERAEINRGDVDAVRRRAEERKQEDEARGQEEREAEARLTPEHADFRRILKRLGDRVAGMQLRPSETQAFQRLLDELEKASGHQAEELVPEYVEREPEPPEAERKRQALKTPQP